MLAPHEDDPDRAAFEALAAKWYELSDFLVNVLQVQTVPGRFEGTVTYHDSCSGLRELGVKMQPRFLLSMAGASVAEMSEAEKCCGFGGTFATKFPQISGEMVRGKVADIQGTGAGTIVSSEPGCTMNISGACRRQGCGVVFKSLPEIIAEGLGLLERTDDAGPATGAAR